MDLIHSLPLLKTFYKHINAVDGDGDGDTLALPDLSQLLQLITQHMDILHNKSVFISVLPLLEHALLQLQSSAHIPYAQLDYSADLLNLLNQHADNVSSLQIVLQIIYQILNAQPKESGVNNSYIVLSPAVALRLIELIFTMQPNFIIANLLACLQLYIEKFNAKDITIEMWTRTLAQDNMRGDNFKTAQIIAQLFNEFNSYVIEFIENPQLVQIIKKLLVSKLREERKAATFILKEILNTLNDYSHWNHSQWGCKDIHEFWRAYITILDNLEENQSHLILPSLKIFNHNKYFNPCLKPWQDLLLMKILSHNNILVRRWAIIFVLETLKYTELSKELVLEFFGAINDTSLYVGNFITAANIETFLNGEVLSFLEDFVYINWKSVPMHFWLSNLKLRNLNVPHALLKRLATRIRVLQNSVIRAHAIRTFECVFLKIINNMSFFDYLTLLESLYNASDSFEGGVHFINSRAREGRLNCTNAEEGTFTRKFYELLMSAGTALDTHFLNELQDVPKEKHGWLRFFIVFDPLTDSEQNDFCLEKYDIDLCKIMTSMKSLPEVIAEFCKKLVWHKDELSFVREKSVDFYATHIATTEALQQDGAIEKLLNGGSFFTLETLSLSLFRFDEKLSSVNLMALLQAVKRFPQNSSDGIVSVILTYIKNTHSETETTQYAELLAEYNLKDTWVPLLASDISLSSEFYLKCILYGEAKTGDARIEDYYYFTATSSACDDAIEMRTQYLYILLCKDKRLLDELIKKLLDMNRDISKNKPRYFENSKEHRLKIRILYAIWMLSSQSIEGETWLALWDILLNENNQLNVSCMYELLIALNAPSLTAITERTKNLKALTPSQQVSFIAVIYHYCILLISKNQLIAAEAEIDQNIVDECINTLLPFTMGAHFQTRLYAQLMIYKILKFFRLIHSGITTNRHKNISDAIEVAIGAEKLKMLLHDIRLNLVTRKNPLIFDCVLWVTNAPYDEYRKPYPFLNDFQMSKDLFDKKTQTTTTSNKQPDNEIEFGPEKLQRKMNVGDADFIKNTFLTCPKSSDVEMFLVASLVNKVANIGGLARTCEVLGIKNFVLASKKFVEAEEFKSLSMTAEKGLNLIEVQPANLKHFLLNKIAEGFEIVGAEQTSNSISFADFKFPKKCVLLLGHEKTGIPGDLLSILNYAVEIPQFGLVRSLNVHVTGALFMWAFCKEHLLLQ